MNQLHTTATSLANQLLSITGASNRTAALTSLRIANPALGSLVGQKLKDLQTAAR